MKQKLFALALLASPIAMAAPATAQNADKEAAEVKREMAAFKKLMNAFDADNAEPIDEQQLALARMTAGKILPDGTYGKMMEKTIDQMLAPMATLISQISPEQVSAVTGIEELSLYDLDEDALTRVGALIDPNAEKRGSRVMALMIPMMKEIFTDMEPALREGMARAYARKFSGAQLKELNSFFETPTGSFYASESFVLMADPEVMKASMQAMPMVMERMLGAMPAMEEDMKDLPEPRTLADLSDDELSELAGLLSVSVADLKAHRDNPPQVEEAVE